MYAVIGIFEVVLRNSIDRHYFNKKGHEWLANAVQPGGYLEAAPECINSYNNVQDTIKKLGRDYTHDNLIAKLPFGFWVYQFASKDYSAAGNTLLEILPNRPFRTNQGAVFKMLHKLNYIRNRIAHYEPICFDKDTGLVSVSYTKYRYGIIKELLCWMGGNPEILLYGIDGVPKALHTISNMTHKLAHNQLMIEK